MRKELMKKAWEISRIQGIKIGVAMKMVWDLIKSQDTKISSLNEEKQNLEKKVKIIKNEISRLMVAAAKNFFAEAKTTAAEAKTTAAEVVQDFDLIKKIENSPKLILRGEVINGFDFSVVEKLKSEGIKVILKDKSIAIMASGRSLLKLATEFCSSIKFLPDIFEKAIKNPEIVLYINELK